MSDLHDGVFAISPDIRYVAAGESGSMPGRPMLPQQGGGILIAAPAGARVVVPDVVAGADDSGQRGPVS
jgi:hypothetical protein